MANEKDRFAFNGKDEFTFSNPEGIRFEIITFSRTMAVASWGYRLGITPGFPAMHGPIVSASVAANFSVGTTPARMISRA